MNQLVQEMHDAIAVPLISLTVPATVVPAVIVWLTVPPVPPVEAVWVIVRTVPAEFRAGLVLQCAV